MSDPVRMYQENEELSPQDLNQSGADYGMTFNNESMPFGYNPNENQQQEVLDQRTTPVTTAQAGAIAPRGQAVATDTQNSSRNLLGRIYSAEQPQPKVDQAKLDRIQRMGRLNQLGKGIGVIGDILSLGLGGNVARNAPDTTTPYLMQEYNKTLDKYKDQQDLYDMRKFQTKIDQGKMAYADALQREKDDKENNRYIQGLNEKDKDRKQAQDNADRAYRLQEEGQRLQKEQLEETKRSHKAGEVSDRMRAEASLNQSTNSGMRGLKKIPITLYGKTHILNENQYNQLYSHIAKDKKFDSFRVKMSDFSNNPEQGMDIDIARYVSEFPDEVAGVMSKWDEFKGIQKSKPAEKTQGYDNGFYPTDTIDTNQPLRKDSKSWKPY